MICSFSLQFSYDIDIQEEAPLSVLSGKLLGNASTVWSSKLYLGSHALSSANGCALPMWFCKFLFSLNAALQKSHWKYSINKTTLTTVHLCLLPEMGFHQCEWACGLGEHQVCQKAFHTPDRKTFSPQGAQCHSGCLALSWTCKLFHSRHMQSPSEHSAIYLEVKIF